MNKWMKKISTIGFSLGSIAGFTSFGLVVHTSNWNKDIYNEGIFHGNVVNNFSDYPYMASVNMNDKTSLYDSHYGGASFISQNLLITAGHIVTNDHDGSLIDPKTIKITYGGLNLRDEKTFKTFNVKSVYRMNTYKKVEIAPGLNLDLNDVGIIQIENHPQTVVKTVSLVNNENGARLTASGVKNRIIGWGFSQAFVAVSSKLRYADEVILSNNQVNAELHKLPQIYWNAYYAKQVISNKGLHVSTQGDSGGPELVFDTKINKYVEVGLCSWGPGVVNNHLDFYTRLDNPLYLKWIKNIIQQHQSTF